MGQESAILRQLKEYQEVAAASAQFNDLVSVEELAQKAGGKSIKQVKEILKSKDVKPKMIFGKSYMYSKTELLEKYKITA